MLERENTTIHNLKRRKSTVGLKQFVPEKEMVQGGKYVRVNNNFDRNALVNLRSQLDATVMVDQDKREVSDKVINLFYPFDSQKESIMAEKYGPERQYLYKQFNQLNIDHKKAVLEAERKKKRAETDAIIQEMVAQEQAEEEARMARRQALIDALENIDIE